MGVPDGEGTQTLTGLDCYCLRCSLLHQGGTQNPRRQYVRFIFVEPNPKVSVDCTLINGAFTIDVVRFCQRVVNSVEEWLAARENTDRFKTNYAKFMRRYPDGLSPFIAGCPIIT